MFIKWHITTSPTVGNFEQIEMYNGYRSWKNHKSWIFDELMYGLWNVTGIDIDRK